MKETLEGYGLELVTEVTKDTVEENGKNTDDVVSFGKHQINEMSYLIMGDQEQLTVFYHRFEDNDDGKEEAASLYKQLKNNYKVLPGGKVTENISEEGGSRIYYFKYPLNNQEDTSESDEIGESTFFYTTLDSEVLLVLLIYNEEMNEVGMINEVLATAKDDEFAQQLMIDFGW